MKRFVSILTVFIIAAYCVALSLFVLSVIRAYSHAVPHISPQALVNATRIPLFIVLPATAAAVILAFVTGRGTARTVEADELAVSDEEAPPPERDIPTSISSEQSAPLSPTPDNAAAIPEAVAIVTADAATGHDESPSPKPLEWHLPAPAASSYDEADEGTEKVVATYEITPDDEESAIITRAKDEATSTDDGKASIPVIASEAKQPTGAVQSTMPDVSATVLESATEALSGSEALAQFSEAEAEESPLEAALSHKLVSAAADERDLSLVLIEVTAEIASQAAQEDRNRNDGERAVSVIGGQSPTDSEATPSVMNILGEVFGQHDLFEYAENTYALVKVGMTLDEALSAAEKVYNALPHDKGQCAIGISSRAIRLIGPATLLREAVAALERAKTEDTPIMAFRADTDKYRATLLSS